MDYLIKLNNETNLEPQTMKDDKVHAKLRWFIRDTCPSMRYSSNEHVIFTSDV